MKYFLDTTLVNIANSNYVYMNDSTISENVYLNAFQLLNVKIVKFGNVSCLYNNLRPNIFHSDLGSCFVFYEIKNIIIVSSFIKFCFSDSAATGIRIVYSDINAVTSNYTVNNKLKFLEEIINFFFFI